MKSEQNELSVINFFLPKQLNEEETLKICESIIKDVGATSLKDMGKIMGKLKATHGDVIDFSNVNNLLKNFKQMRKYPRISRGNKIKTKVSKLLVNMFNSKKRKKNSSAITL